MNVQLRRLSDEDGNWLVVSFVERRILCAVEGGSWVRSFTGQIA